jgi:hypothetical protein
LITRGTVRPKEQEVYDTIWGGLWRELPKSNPITRVRAIELG